MNALAAACNGASTPHVPGPERLAVCHAWAAPTASVALSVAQMPVEEKVKELFHPAKEREGQTAPLTPDSA